MAICPCHDDTEPSLHLSQKDNITLIYCFGCGAGYGEVAEKLSLAPIRNTYELYDYCDEEGKLLYQKVRFYPKRFAFRRPTPDGSFVWDAKGVRRVLYNLPEVKKAEEVWIVEGEKDADRLIKEGFAATTNDAGAGKWDPNYAKALKDKVLRIVPDNDEPGQKHAELVAFSTFRYAREIKLLKLPEEYKDVSEYLAERSIEDLLALEKETPPWTPAPVKKANIEIRGTSARLDFPEQSARLTMQRLKLHSDGRLTCILKVQVGSYTIPGSGVLNLAAPGTRKAYAKSLSEEMSLPWQDMLELAYQEAFQHLIQGEPAFCVQPALKKSYPFLISGLLPLGMETLLWGMGGSGKSWLAQVLANHINSGEPFLGHKVNETGRTLYLDWETNLEEASRRLQMILRGEDYDGYLYYKRCETSLESSLDYLYGLITEIDPAFIVIDSMARAMGGSLLEEDSVSAFIRAVRSLGRTSLIIHHPTKAALSEGGTNTFYGSAYAMWLPRAVWKLESHESLDGTIRGILTQMKTNIGRKEPPIAFRMSIEPFEFLPISVEEAQGGMKLTQLVEMELSKHGKMTVSELASALDQSSGAIRKILSRLAQKERVKKDQEGCWYLPAEIPF
ncbi:MAG: AAA family ATPase [Candidatus Methanosuratincola petrocarbonis]